jgi:hypothetical protein
VRRLAEMDVVYDNESILLSPVGTNFLRVAVWSERHVCGLRLMGDDGSLQLAYTIVRSMTRRSSGR